MCLRFLAALLLAQLAPGPFCGPAAASTVRYQYVGAEDAACRIGGGRTGHCTLRGEFILDADRLGQAQPARGTFELFVDGAAHSDILLFEVPDPVTGLSQVPNRVTADSTGHVTSFLFSAASPYTTGASVTFDSDHWHWSSFSAHGLSGGTGSAEIFRRLDPAHSRQQVPEIAPVPLPGPAGLLLAGCISLAGAARIRRRN